MIAASRWAQALELCALENFGGRVGGQGQFGPWRLLLAQALRLYCFAAKLWIDMEEAMFVSLQKRGVLALPKPMLRRHHLDAPGAQVEVIEREDGVIELHPHVSIPASQAWFLTPAWQEKVQTSVAQIEAGEGQIFENEDDFLAALDDA